MANKIVQLVDNESNNIFPVAGSMKGDSITTAMLQDGAVTSDKIDFTTFIQVGSVSLLALRPKTGSQVRVYLSTPFSDTSYKIFLSLSSTSSTITSYTTIRMTADTKSTDSFYIHYYNSSTDEAIGGDFVINWMAIKI